MTSIKQIGSQKIFTQQDAMEQVPGNENVNVTNYFTQPTAFETPKSLDFLDKALLLPPSANGRRELFTENNVNKFIQSNVKVEDQIGICQNLQPWIKSNFRLHAVQQKTPLNELLN